MNWVDPLSSHLGQARRRVGPVILMYHGIGPARRDPDWLWSVALDRFVAQVDFLRAAGWKFCRISDLEDPCADDAKSIALSFDDGYRNNFPAAEALAERGVPATWFVVSARVGAPAEWEAGPNHGWDILDGAQLREMAGLGMEIGGHTRRHCRLTVATPDELTYETRGCREELEDILGRPVTAFAYPYGDHDDAVVAAVGKAGFRVACTTRAGGAWAEGHPLRLRRLAVYSHDNVASLSRKIGLLRNEATWGHVKDHLLGGVRSPARS